MDDDVRDPSAEERPIVTLMGHVPGVEPEHYVEVARANGSIPPGAVILTGALVEAAMAVWGGAPAAQAAATYGIPVEDVELAATQLRRPGDDTPRAAGPTDSA